MANIVVVGMQWGDEAKGKVVDYLAQDADLVVRYQSAEIMQATRLLLVMMSLSFILFQ